MRYAYIEENRDDCAIIKMCCWLDVSRSGFYKWRKKESGPREQRRQLVEQAVVTIFHQFKRRYGARRVAIELQEEGIPCSVNHIAQLMAENGLLAKNGKNYKYFPSVQATNHVSDNLLARDFSANKPNEKWVSDITYIKVDKGFVYLAVIMDLFSRKIIGWSLDTTMTNQLIIDALNMAKGSRKIEPGLILHSDRGVQYRSGEYQHLLITGGIKPSMSRKGNCWDNAAMESFFGRFKVESIFGEQIHGKKDAYAAVFEYIELFYNSIRRHSTIGYFSPNRYEKNYYEKCA